MKLGDFSERGEEIVKPNIIHAPDCQCPIEKARERVIKAAKRWEKHWAVGDLSAKDGEKHPADIAVSQAVKRLNQLEKKS